MNLELDTEQRELVAATAEVCAALADGWRDGSPELKTLAEVGVLGVRHPEPEGSGLGPVDAVLAARECGAALAPTPLLIWADLVGPAVPGVLSGATSVTGVFDDPAAGVPFGGDTDAVVLVEDAGARVVESAALTWHPVPSVDPAVPRAVPSDIPAGERIAGPVADWRWQSRLLAAAHLVGVGRGAVDGAVAYALEREQFGRVIGSFQAIKHLLADAYTAVELAYSQTLVAAVCWAEGDPAAADQARVAALVAGRAALLAGETAIQVHGGMGFTWEARPHRYYKRALGLTAEFGVTGRELAHRDLTVSGRSG